MILVSSVIIISCNKVEWETTVSPKNTTYTYFITEDYSVEIKKDSVNTLIYVRDGKRAERISYSRGPLGEIRSLLLCTREKGERFEVKLSEKNDLLRTKRFFSVLKHAPEDVRKIMDIYYARQKYGAGFWYRKKWGNGGRYYRYEKELQGHNGSDFVAYSFSIDPDGRIKIDAQQYASIQYISFAIDADNLNFLLAAEYTEKSDFAGFGEYRSYPTKETDLLMKEEFTEALEKLPEEANEVLGAYKKYLALMGYED